MAGKPKLKMPRYTVMDKVVVCDTPKREAYIEICRNPRTNQIFIAGTLRVWKRTGKDVKDLVTEHFITSSSSMSWSADKTDWTKDKIVENIKGILERL